MRHLAGKLRHLRRFPRAESGLAAVEFALILPVLIVMFFGVVELSLAVLCRNDIYNVASTAADLIAQESVVAPTDISNVYAAANTILYPYYPNFSTSKPTIRITSVIYDTVAKSTTAGKVAWTCIQPGSGTLSPANRAPSSTVTFAQPLLSSGSSVIMTEVAYSYASPTTQVVTGPFNLIDSFFTKPRRVSQIAAPTPLPTGCTSAG